MLLKQVLWALNRERYGDSTSRTQEAFDVLCEKQNRALVSPNSPSFSELNDASAIWNH